MGRSSSATCDARGIGSRVPARWLDGHEAPGDGRRLPGRRGAGVPPLAQGRRHRAEPHAGHPRHPLRPLVEPGRRGPGHRPRLPHRPGPSGAGPPPRRRGHDRGPHRAGARAKRDLAERWSATARRWIARAVRRRPDRARARWAPADGAAGPGDCASAAPHDLRLHLVGPGVGATPSSTGPGSTRTGSRGAAPTPAEHGVAAGGRSGRGAAPPSRGAERQPYAVRVRVRQFGDDEWEQVFDAIAARAGQRRRPARRRAGARASSRTRRRGGRRPAPRRGRAAAPVLLPRLGRPLQARGRGLLPGGRPARRRSLRPLPAARPRPRAGDGWRAPPACWGPAVDGRPGVVVAPGPARRRWHPGPDRLRSGSGPSPAARRQPAAPGRAPRDAAGRRPASWARPAGRRADGPRPRCLEPGPRRCSGATGRRGWS